MDLENGKISVYQLLSLAACLVLGSTTIVIPGRDAGHDMWLALIIGFLESLIFVFVFTALANRFPGQTPVQFNDTLFGPYLGKLISVTELWFLLHLVSMVVRVFSDYFVTVELKITPLEVIIIILLFICSSAVRNGIEVTGRCAPIILAFLLVTTLTTMVLLIPDMKTANFFPLMEVPLPALLKAGHEIATVPFGETVAFLMVLPFINQPRKGRRFLLIGMAVGCVVLLIATVRNIATLGPLAEITVYPSVQSVRLINLADILTRLEILFSISLLIIGFIQISILYYGVVLGTAQLFKLKTYLPLVYPIGTIIVILSLVNFSNVLEGRAFFSETSPYYFMPFELVIPLFSLIIAMIRGKKPVTKTNLPTGNRQGK